MFSYRILRLFQTLNHKILSSISPILLSQYQRSQYREQFLPEVDHRLAVWQAYLNVVNAFQGLEMFTGASQGEMIAISQVPIERFKFSLAILDALLEQDKDDAFKTEKPASVADMLEEEPNQNGDPNKQYVKLPRYFRYWSRMDKLMRDQGFYTTSKLPSGHL